MPAQGRSRPIGLTTGKAPERLGASVPTNRRWAERGVLPATDIGTGLLASESESSLTFRLRGT